MLAAVPSVQVPQPVLLGVMQGSSADPEHFLGPYFEAMRPAPVWIIGRPHVDDRAELLTNPMMEPDGSNPSSLEMPDLQALRLHNRTCGLSSQ
jgi:hypothetical protein